MADPSLVDPMLAAGTATLTGLVVAVSVRPILLRLPEPLSLEPESPEPESPATKTPYRDLASPSFVVVCVATAAAAQVLTLFTLPANVQPIWTVLATVGVLLAAIDASTTWLPRRLMQAGWALMSVAVGLSAVLGATGVGVLRTLAGAAIAGSLYLGVWAVTRGGFGFGDVRFAPLLGAALASHSWTLLIWGLTFGTLLGAVHGCWRLLRRRRDGFPYAPSMLAGSYLAVLVLRLMVGFR